MHAGNWRTAAIKAEGVGGYHILKEEKEIFN